MMLVWNNLADPHLSAFSHFAWFSQTVTLKIEHIRIIGIGLELAQLQARLMRGGESFQMQMTFISL